MLTEEKGIQAIIALQNVAGITETEEQARAGWRKMLDWEKEETEAAHYMFCGGFPEEVSNV